MADLDSLKLVASMEVFMEQHTNESTDCPLPAVRDFFTRLHGRAEAHASVEDLYGYLLVRKNF